MWPPPAPAEARHVPGAHAEAMGPHDERALGLHATVLGQQRAEVGIGVQKPNRLVPRRRALSGRCG